MSLQRNDSYERARELDAAAIARRRGRVQEAISHYERVLRAEPKNPELLRRIAPLFAQANEPDRAWNSYRAAAQEFLSAGFADKAIGVYREAAQVMPRTAIAWLSIAELEQSRGRIVDAKLALLTGRGHYREREDACVAADLLRRALAIDASDFDARLDLAHCERKAGETRLALASLAEALALRPDTVKRIRWEELRTERTSVRFFAWLRALVTTPPPRAHHPQLARANSAPERRGVKLALRPATLKSAPSPAIGESWRAAHAS
ncbi:MAG: tetratricopeptide repeat protein [Deltaproteobacteria bacterium]|nr:tetratricopeptide repeat protein [Deltaproteobacteria bacterium]